MEKEAFKRKVYITYKSRINAAERLKKTEVFIQVINIYYSIFMTALAIYSVNNNSSRLALMITIFSVIITITIVFLASQKYGERAKSLKNNYITLFKLYSKIDKSSYDNDDEIQQLLDEYSELLDNSENHTQYDYYKAMRIIKDTSKLTKTQKSEYLLKYWGSIGIKIALTILPLLLKYFAMLLEWIISF